MTSGADILFPGGSQLLDVGSDEALRLLRDVAELQPPEFAYISINAWGDPGNVGTLAVIDDVQLIGFEEKATLLCTGISRFRVLHLAEDMKRARVEIFHDDHPRPEEKVDLNQLEEKVVATMTDIVQLSIKISAERDESRHTALTETLKRVEAFCGKCDEQESRKLLQHWIVELSPHLRTELLSFIVIDLLSISFMDRKNLMLSTNTGNRLAEALRCLHPFVKELAAKGAIISALGKDIDVDGTSSTS